ncbi:oligopeptide transporter, OPT family [bacterium]|nr:oligopeptide transporter, OPT family [bacterium]
MKHEHKPYIPSESTMKDSSIRALVVGVIFGILFGSANAYLGLRVGLTISTAIPLAVISVAVFRVLKPIWGESTILEHNISQTTGSASSSLASGIIFTIPALFLWGLNPEIAQIGMLALLGGTLGVLFMIPLRPFLIVKKHHELPYPEGTASAEVLMAADAGGSRAKDVFIGLGVGAVYKFITSFLKLWPEHLSLKLPLLPKAMIGLEAGPALIGVGYILNYRIAAIMVAGGLLSWLGVIPLIALFGDKLDFAVLPATKLISEMSPQEIWHNYIRYIGAGAVAFAGIISVIKSLPTMYKSFQIGIKGFTASKEAKDLTPRTERDLPMSVILAGIAIVVLIITFTPNIIAGMDFFFGRLVCALCIAFFAFVFVTVSSRIVGMVGVTSNPTSGMTIVTLIGTSIIFYLLGWRDITGKAAALTVGTVVAIAASIAGDISQDLKTGYLIGATPKKQQFGELVGTICSAFFIAGAVWLLGATFGFGSTELPAPQATLMKTVIEGVLQANLPWGLVLAGAAMAGVSALLGVPPLAFAVGMYLPLSTMTPVFIGGLIRRIVEHVRTRREKTDDVSKDQGILFGSGLIAGEGILGVCIALFAFFAGKPKGLGLALPDGVGEALSLVAFLGLGLILFRIGKKKHL